MHLLSSYLLKPVLHSTHQLSSASFQSVHLAQLESGQFVIKHGEYELRYNPSSHFVHLPSFNPKLLLHSSQILFGPKHLAQLDSASQGTISRH